jgi:hypothetical protein
MSFIVNDHQQAKRLRGFDDFCSRHFVPVEIKQPVFFEGENNTAALGVLLLWLSSR